MIIQQQDYDIIQQRIINRYLKVNLLNFDYTFVDELSGNVMSFDVSVDADSDIRRTCNVEIVVTDSSFDIKAGSKIWLDKMIQPYIGIENIRRSRLQKLQKEKSEIEAQYKKGSQLYPEFRLIMMARLEV